MVRIVSMCGSLGVDSANRRALALAERRLVEAGLVDGVVEASLADVPMFDPSVVDHPPASVAVLRSMVESADGVLLAAPEYAGGVAGGMKNALDWLVGSGSLYRRPVAILSAGTTGGHFAIEQLVRTATWHGAFAVSTLGISAPRTKIDPHLGYTDPATIDQIEAWALALAEAIALSPDQLSQHAAAVAAAVGVDTAHLGGMLG